uniref:Angiomotin-like protein 2 n=1 Tax=Phallusia mammillata TaxID=59560 RepID=A0A6F9D654_9ASCI|nr:angiomotin-like protein 2 [Phallusia mammillata]
MTERNGGTVLHRLLAEKFKNDDPFASSGQGVFNSICSPSQLTTNPGVGDISSNQYNSDPSQTTESDPEARLDALCRSTLQRSGDESCPQTQSSSAPSRRPPPSYAEARLEITHTPAETPDRTFSSTVPQMMTPRYHKSPSPSTSADNKHYKHPSNKRMQESSKSADAVKERIKLNGHPKSNSGGDEYLYTDSLRSSDSCRKVQLRGIRGRKNSSVTRSSSLHQNQEDKTHFHRVSLEEQRFLPLSNEKLNAIHNSPKTNQEPPKSKHTTSLSNTTNTGRKPGHKEQRRYSAHSSPFQTQSPRSSEDAIATAQTPTYAQVGTNQNSDSSTSEAVHPNGVSSNMPQTPTANPNTTFVRNQVATPTMHGHYYQPVGMMGQNQTAAPAHVQLINTQSPPRRPPPPYPAGMMGLEQVAVQQQEDASTWQPQRPNSLALGQPCKKKGNSCGSALNSPTVTSPTSIPNSFPGTPMRGTPFYSTNKESPYATPGFQQHYQAPANTTTNNLPHQRQTSNGNGNGQYLTRTNSGRNVLMQGTSSSSSSSTATAVSTPNYQEMPSFPEVPQRSPVQPSTNTYAMQNPSNSNYLQDAFVPVTNGVGVSKSDSMNSGTSTTSSGASRIARRRKRNSSSKGNNYQTNTSSSGSSSNGGSRPNSNADLTDRLLVENENLSVQLQTYQMKLKRFETIQAELQRITEEHHALYLSANKREALENELKNKLTAKVNRLEQEKQTLESKILVMTGDLKAINLSSKDDEAKERNIMQLFDSQNRKFAEKERQLQEELEECRERLSEQNGEIDLLSSSLSKAEATITCFKEKFLQSTEVDTHTEQLSERLTTLQKIVEERQDVESELRDRLKRQLLQRPLRSTSSNDEGISEMDATADAPGSGFVDLFNNRESQMLGVKAEMLKWQHMYLEQGLLQHVQTSGNAQVMGSRTKIYKALRNHRHTISDPGFDKISIVQCSFPSTPNSLTQRQRKIPQTDTKATPVKNNSASDLSNAAEKETSCHRETAKHSTDRIDCACQTPDGDWALGKGAPVAGDAGSSQCSAGRSGTGRNSMIETEPSEGYHSQQSSGSPTPNTEKSSVHFPTPGDYSGSANTTPMREISTGVIRRNRSADVLQSLNV